MNFFMMPAGDYEFPFNIPLDEHTIETIRGPSQNQHTYQVHGIVERRLGKDIIVSEPIGIYKSPAVPLGFMMSSPALVEGSLGDLVQYNVSIPDVNIPFGSTFPVKFSLVPLSKDISLGTITLEVVEEHKIKIDAPAAYSARYNIRHLASKAKHVILAEQHEPDDYVSERPEVFEIEWCTAKKVSLPRDFASCTQSVQTGVFKINHLLAVTITVKDARGGLSMIKETIPFKIAMSPYVIGQDGTIYSVDMEELEHDSSPSPPVYNDHKKDVLLAGYQQVTETSTEDLLYRLRHHAHTPDTFRFDSNEFGSPPDYELLVANNP
ncbi:hypothetical protein ARAM_000555 [Aspergillus rambellii]|uniref:Arrestin C-terminal-like domain-containing protein n=2 Tax=Aspergillus subgen. Nidulantes TaxID=2720870 RepID=A0A0F8U0F8_9EURO|nr:hypothetical protein ARAM_000555 [Aspergillus rambellii]KKK14098.1 hypothetical protein AOCH_000883 [Aspergillus ochraceoroseus]